MPGERARERLAVAGLAAQVAVLPACGVAYVETEWYPFVVVGGLGIALLAVLSLFEAGQLVYYRGWADRVPYAERLSPDQWGALVGLPFGTTLGAVLGAAAPILMERPATRAVGITMLGAALAVPLAVAWGVTQRLLAVRAGRALPLHDETLPAGDRLADADRRFARHLAERRWLLARRRTRWLGSADAPAPAPWPTAPGRPFGSPWVLVPAGTALAAAAVTTLAVAVSPALRWSSPDTYVVAASGALAAFTAGVRLARATVEEQVAADRLRERIGALRAAVAAQRPAPVVVPESRWRRAWAVLTGRDSGGAG